MYRTIRKLTLLGMRGVMGCALGTLSVPADSRAQTPDITVQSEQGKLIRAPLAMTTLGPDLFGDKINLYNGGLEFVQTDVSLPGNNNLPVRAGRRIVTGGRGNEGGGLFKNWDLDIPSIHGMFATADGWRGRDARGQPSTLRCSNFGAPPQVTRPSSSHLFRAVEFWHGNMLYIPGHGEQEILKRHTAYNNNIPTDGAATPLVTRDAWAVRCLGALASTDAATPANDAGEGFLAIAPDGTQYRFDWLVSRSMSTISKPIEFRATPSVVAPQDPRRAVQSPDVVAAKPPLPTPNGTGSMAMLTIHRTEVSIFPTLVTDRFGNTVRYTFDPVDKWKLLSIKSADGAGNPERALTFTYVPGTHQIESVGDGMRTWMYAYGEGASGYTVLSTVTLPDGSAWKLGELDGVAGDAAPGLVTMVLDARVIDPDDLECDPQTGLNSPIAIGLITHPSGAVGKFVMTPTQHARNGVPRACYSDVTRGPASAYFPRYYGLYSITEKTINGPGMEEARWTSRYDTFNPGWADCVSCAVPSTVSVTDPKGDVTRYSFGSTFGVDEGMPKRIDVGWDGGAALRTTAIGYDQSFTEPLGLSDQDRGDGKINARLMPEDLRTITQQGVTFTWQVPSSGNFDRFGRALRAVRSSSLGMSRTEATEYADNTVKWVLGQVAKVTEQSTGRVVVLNTYNPASANLESVSRFGRVDLSMTYNPDGTVLSRKDGKNQQTTFAHYKRGIAQNIRYPDGTAENCVVNNDGAVSAHTDANGFTTFYDSDAMGRLSKIRYPAADTLAWNPTTISHQQVQEVEFDLAPGHWRQDVTTGNARTSTYYDAMWRPVYTHTADLASVTSTARIVKRGYDHAGRLTYASYPQRDYGALGDGVHRQYDGLGRPTVTGVNSELGTLTSGYVYQENFTTSHTDARGKTTRTSYQVFDQPSEAAIASIAAPLGVTVNIARDVFGKPLALTRSGGGKSATRNYVYDTYQRLCKTIEPETAATVLDYDPANNVIMRAGGLALPSATRCDRADVPANKKIAYSFDVLNRLTTTRYSDGSPAVERSYWPDGLPKTIVSNGSTWTYTFNQRRLNESESLDYGGHTYNIARAYDASASLLRLRYPVDNLTVEYAPNALGEPTQIGDYASLITYHPNGAVHSFSYGNGIRHTMEQNIRQLPATAIDGGDVQNDAYSYDENANVVGIADQQMNVSGRTMGYDDLDRLLTVAAPGMWGRADYTHDALDNLTSATITSGATARATTHTIDPVTNRLGNIGNGAAAYNFAYVYDSQGNIVKRGAQAFVFDQANRMTSAPGKATYAYDGLGRRFSVVGTDGVNRVQVYSQEGQLLYAGPTGGIGTKYIYLHRHQIAEVRQ